MAQSANIQAQLDRLRASLDPSNGTGSTPVPMSQNNVAPKVNTTVPNLGRPGIMPLSSFVDGGNIVQGQSSCDKPSILKKYGKYIMLGVVVILLGVLFYKRRKSMMGSSKSTQGPSVSSLGLLPGAEGMSGHPEQPRAKPFIQQRQIPGSVRGYSGQQYQAVQQQRAPPHHATQQHAPRHQASQHQVPQHLSHCDPLARSAQANDPNFTEL